jgi:hypothetical protein
MATMRPDANDTTGTFLEMSGVTAPVTTNSDDAGRAVAAASGNCSGWSTAKSVGSAPGTTLAGGGASAAASPCALSHPPRTSNAAMEMRSSPILRPLFFMSKTRSQALSPLKETAVLLSPTAGTTEEQRQDRVEFLSAAPNPCPRRHLSSRGREQPETRT